MRETNPEAVQVLIRDIRSLTNKAAMIGLVNGDEVFAAMAHVLAEHIAKCRPAVRQELVDTIGMALTAAVEFEAGDEAALQKIELALFQGAKQ